MKVGIITCFDAVNYGSFWQAYALQETLKSLGADEIKMIKTSSPLYEKWRYTSLFTYKPSKIKFKFKLAKGYFKIWKKFKITRDKTGYDLVIVGSDEMWNLKNITMTALPEFFGVGVETKKLVSYAVSCNNTTSKDVESCDFAKKGIKNFRIVSFRDEATKDAYESFVQTETRIDVDPTFLVDLKKYVHPTGKKGYILVYTYGFADYMITGVMNLAKKLNKKVVMVGQNYSWPDERVPADAFEFLSLINDADLIITDTFHGTVLSIGLNKPVLAYANHKPKVYRILEQLDLLHRNVSDIEDLESAYNTKIDYDTVNAKLSDLRKNSLAYLRKCMED